VHRLPGRAVASVRKEERLEALQLAPAEVVGAALQHLHVDLAADRGGGDGHVVVQELLLQGLRRRRDDDPLPGFEGRHEVGKALPHARSRLGDEVLAEAERALDGRRERRLLGPGLEPGQGALERAANGEHRIHRGDKPTGANGRSPAADVPRHGFVRKLRHSGRVAVDGAGRTPLGSPPSDPVALRSRRIRHSAPVGLRTRRG
jgi:hypothetical protein